MPVCQFFETGRALVPYDKEMGFLKNKFCLFTLAFSDTAFLFHEAKYSEACKNLFRKAPGSLTISFKRTEATLHTKEKPAAWKKQRRMILPHIPNATFSAGSVIKTRIFYLKKEHFLRAAKLPSEKVIVYAPDADLLIQRGTFSPQQLTTTHTSEQRRM